MCLVTVNWCEILHNAKGNRSTSKQTHKYDRHAAYVTFSNHSQKVSDCKDIGLLVHQVAMAGIAFLEAGCFTNEVRVNAAANNGKSDDEQRHQHWLKSATVHTWTSDPVRHFSPRPCNHSRRRRRLVLRRLLGGGVDWSGRIWRFRLGSLHCGGLDVQCGQELLSRRFQDGRRHRWVSAGSGLGWFGAADPGRWGGTWSTLLSLRGRRRAAASSLATTDFNSVAAAHRFEAGRVAPRRSRTTDGRLVASIDRRRSESTGCSGSATDPALWRHHGFVAWQRHWNTRCGIGENGGRICDRCFANTTGRGASAFVACGWLVGSSLLLDRVRWFHAWRTTTHCVISSCTCARCLTIRTFLIRAVFVVLVMTWSLVIWSSIKCT